MSRPHSPPTGSPPTETSHERRRTPRRRLRDRIASLDRTTNQALRRPEIANLVMIVEDDLRQTALALGAVEQYLGKAHGLLEQPDVTAQALVDMARDPDVVTRIDDLSENLANLRRTMHRIAAAMK